MVLDIQGNESTLTDPEIATKTLSDEEEQFFLLGKPLLTCH